MQIINREMNLIKRGKTFLLEYRAIGTMCAWSLLIIYLLTP